MLRYSCMAKSYSMNSSYITETVSQAGLTSLRFLSTKISHLQHHVWPLNICSMLFCLYLIREWILCITWNFTVKSWEFSDGNYSQPLSYTCYWNFLGLYIDKFPDTKKQKQKQNMLSLRRLDKTALKVFAMVLKKCTISIQMLRSLGISVESNYHT